MARRRNWRWMNTASSEPILARRTLEIWLKITAPDDTLVGVKVDQDQRPILEQAHLRDNRPPQRHRYRSYID